MLASQLEDFGERAGLLLGMALFAHAPRHAQAGPTLSEDVLRPLVSALALARQLQNVGERAGLLPGAALLAHAPIAGHQVGQAKHDAQPNHHKQCDQPLQGSPQVSRHSLGPQSVSNRELWKAEPGKAHPGRASTPNPASSPWAYPDFEVVDRSREPYHGAQYKKQVPAAPYSANEG